MTEARSEAVKNILWGAVGVGLGGGALYWVFSTVRATGISGNAKAVVAGGGLFALVGSIKLSQGILALLFGVRISVEDFDSLKGRDRTFTALFAGGWLVGVFVACGMVLKYGDKWF